MARLTMYCKFWRRFPDSAFIGACMSRNRDFVFTAEIYITQEGWFLQHGPVMWVERTVML